MDIKGADAWQNKGLALDGHGIDTEAKIAFARAKDLGFKADSSFLKGLPFWKTCSGFIRGGIEFLKPK